MAKRKEPDMVEVQVSKCQKCGSTRRSEYHGTQTIEQAFPGIASDGTEYTHTIWRRCACLDCGQHRIDIYRENRAESSGYRTS